MPLQTFASLNQSLGDWVEDNLVAPPAWRRSGPFHLAKWQKDILDDIDRDGVKEVSFQMASQLFKTLGMDFLTCGFIVRKPSPTFKLYPVKDLAQRHLNTKFNPLLKANPIVRDALILNNRGVVPVTGAATRTGAFLAFGWVGSDSSVSETTPKIGFADEIDKYMALTTGKEGSNPIDILRNRTSEWVGQSLIVIASVPQDRADSLIVPEYEKGSRTIPYIPCPHCGDFWPIQHENVRKGVLYCRSCAASLTQREVYTAIDLSILTDENKDAPEGFRSYYANRYYSPIHTVKDVFELSEKWDTRTFTQQVLGLPMERTIREEPEDDYLASLKKHFTGEESAVTASMDIQKDRVEVQVVIWEQVKPHIAAYEIFYYDPSMKDEARIESAWTPASKLLDKYAIDKFAVDVGFLPELTARNVKKYFRPYYHSDKVLFVKGDERRSTFDMEILQATRKMKSEDEDTYTILATDEAKVWVHDVIGSGEMTITPDKARLQGGHKAFWRGIFAEELRYVTRPNGTESLKWAVKSGVRNEPLDLLVYNLGARLSLGYDYKKQSGSDYLEMIERNRGGFVFNL